MGMISFWQVFDGLVPKMLTQTFGLSNWVTGIVMALDNIFGLFLLPWFGILSDRCHSRLGRRTPFILLGSALAAISVPLIAVANNQANLAFLIAMILVTLVAICSYRTATIAIVADITPRPLRTKGDSVDKIVGYAGTGAMLVAISLLVPSVDHPDYVPVFALQGVLIAVAAIAFKLLLNEPRAVEKMHEESRQMGIEEDEIDDAEDDSVSNERVRDPDLARSIGLLLGAVFFYYMSYNAMTTNISRYASDFFSMGGGSYAMINIVTIAGGLASYVPMANLSLKVGRKRVAFGAGVVMAACPVVLWLYPSFSPVYYVLFLLMGASLGTVDLCVYPMILENCSARSVGRYSGYYYTVSMAAQVVTPILSGIIMDVAEGQLFLYIAVMGALMCVFIALTRHGDSILADEILRREADSH
jgi:MFS family permease